MSEVPPPTETKPPAESSGNGAKDTGKAAEAGAASPPPEQQATKETQQTTDQAQKKPDELKIAQANGGATDTGKGAQTDAAGSALEQSGTAPIQQTADRMRESTDQKGITTEQSPALPKTENTGDDQNNGEKKTEKKDEKGESGAETGSGQSAETRAAATLDVQAAAAVAEAPPPPSGRLAPSFDKAAGDDRAAIARAHDAAVAKEKAALLPADRKLAEAHVIESKSDLMVIGMHRPEDRADLAIPGLGRPEGAQGLTIRGSDYIETAKAMGAGYFDIGKTYDGMTPAKREAMNQVALDKAMEEKFSIFLSVEKSEVQPDSPTAREIKYLLDKGYVQVEGSDRLFRPANLK